MDCANEFATHFSQFDETPPDKTNHISVLIRGKLRTLSRLPRHARAELERCKSAMYGEVLPQVYLFTGPRARPTTTPRQGLTARAHSSASAGANSSGNLPSTCK